MSSPPLSVNRRGCLAGPFSIQEAQVIKSARILTCSLGTVFLEPQLEKLAVTVLGLSRKAGCLRSIFALSITELRPPNIPLLYARMRGGEYTGK